jgi:hypothetical protein
MKHALAVILAFLSLTASAARGEATDALAELNAKRARQGLYAFQRDESLTVAAMRCAEVRAARRIPGHCNDFAYLPPGSFASGAGCGAASDSWGWLTCFMDDRSHAYAGAAWVRGADGQRYMHLFVSNRPNGPLRQAVKTVASVAVHPVKTVRNVRNVRSETKPATAQRKLQAHYMAYAITAKSGWCLYCNQMHQAKLADRMRTAMTVLEYDVDGEMPAALPRGPVPQVWLFRDGYRVRQWIGYSAEIDRQIREEVK